MSNLIGQTLGPYRIIEQIGIGGMATVYKAYQPSMDRYVAIKVLPAIVSRDPAFLKRFRRETKVVAKLEHKHILPVHDYGEQEGLTYLVMRYVEAGTLKDRLAADQLDLPAIYRIIAQVGAALDYAHRLGVIHRDVKPTNVLIDSQGDAYLTDFGLARIMESSEQLTATGVGVGTPAYMAPEQGQGLKIDHRSDIYSLGVMLYEMVTGRVPYEAETPMAVVIKHITEPLPLPRQIVPDLPEEVERVILKALAKKPEDRFQTVREMVEALDLAVRAATAAAPTTAWVEGEVVPPVLAAPAREFRWPWNVRTTALGVGIAALALLVIGGMFFALSRIQYRVQVVGGRVEVVSVSTEAVTSTPAVALVETPAGEAALGTSTPTPTVSPTNTPTVTRTPIPPTLTPTLVSPTPTPVPPTPTLTRVPPTSTPVLPAPTSFGRIVYSDGKTGNDEIYVANSDGSDEQRLTDHAGGDWEPTWSPDGTRIVFCSDHHAIGEDRNQLYVMDADGSNLTRLTYTVGNDEHPSWSPDGSRIAFHSNGALAVINPDGSNWTTVVEVRDDVCVQHPTWSPDSRRFAFRSRTPCGDPGPFQHVIYVVNGDGSGLLKLASFTSETAAWYVVWSPDGGQVAFDVILNGQQRYYIVNSDGSGEPAEIPSIPDSWYPWYWPQWGQVPGRVEISGRQLTDTATPIPTPVPSLSGRVIDAATGQGIAGAMVEARLVVGPHGWDYSATTASDGGYAIFDLPTGDYVVWVTASGYAREYWDNVTPSHEATLVRVTAAQGTSGIDFDLTEGGSISGHVYQSDGLTSIGGAQIKVSPSKYKDDDGFHTITSLDGSYTVDGLSLGHYKVRAEAPGYARLKYYDGAYGWENAISVEVAPPDIIPSINISLDPAGSISGYVYESDGVTPIAGARLVADTTTGGWEGIQASSNADGSYIIEGLPPSGYIVRVENPVGFATEFYDAKASRNTADVLSVAGGQEVAGIDFTLEVGAPIRGHVYNEETGEPISGAQVKGTWQPDDGGVLWVNTMPDGSYELWVGTGCYLVGIGGITKAPGYVPEYWNNRYSIADAEPVCVTAPAEAAGIDLHLAHAGSISGHVHAQDGTTPIAGASVYAFPTTGGHPGAGANTQPDGSYTIQGLPSGNYRVQVTASGLVSQPIEVTVNAPNDTPGIDFALSPVSG